MPKTKYFSIINVMRMLGISRAAVLNLEQTSKIPKHIIFNEIQYWKKADIYRYLRIKND